MTRNDYMSGKVDHHTYYLAVADAMGRERVARIVRYIATPEQIRGALETDQHLNNIPLRKWDACHASVLQLVRENGPAVMAISWSGQPLKPHTVCWSLSESVCVLKAVAREMAKETVSNG